MGKVGKIYTFTKDPHEGAPLSTVRGQVVGSVGGRAVTGGSI